MYSPESTLETETLMGQFRDFIDQSVENLGESHPIISIQRAFYNSFECAAALKNDINCCYDETQRAEHQEQLDHILDEINKVAACIRKA